MRRSVLASGAIVAGLAVACAQRVTDPATDDPNRFSGIEGACDAEGNAIVAVSSDGDFYRYTPSTRSFERLSHAACRPGGGVSVFGAAVDRHGEAWLTYWEGSLIFPTPSDGGSSAEAGTLQMGRGLPDGIVPKAQLYPVHVADGTCGTPVAYDPNDFPVRAITASNTPGLLFGLRLEDRTNTRVDVGLITLDTTTGQVTASTELGPMKPYAEPIDGAITQRSDGKLVGFFNALAESVNVRPYFVTINPANGLMASAPGTFPHIDTRSLSTNAPDLPSAVVVWGSERWLFTGDPATERNGFSASGSMLTRVPSDGTDSENMNRELDFLVVGAGVVACGAAPSPR